MVILIELNCMYLITLIYIILIKKKSRKEHNAENLKGGLNII